MDASAPALLARGLEVTVAGRRVCRGLDLAVGPGQCLAILGRNGAGKTTLLHTLAGLRAPAAGEILLTGMPYGQLGARRAAALRGILLQHQVDHFSATVLETALVGRHPHLGRWAWENGADYRAARAALADVGLAGLEERDIFTLSGGERQRLAIATLLAQAPRVFLLDEPLAHLDLNYEIAVLELFAARARTERIAVVAVLHDVNLALRYCDQALLLFGDGDAALGPIREIARPDSLTRAYGHPLRELRDGERPVYVPA